MKLINKINLIISVMALILSLLSLWNRNQEKFEGGFEKNMSGDWFLGKVARGNPNYLLSHKDNVKFTFTPDGVLECKGIKVDNLTANKTLNVGEQINCEGAVKAGKAELSSAKIGEWDIRNDRIGIKNRADIYLDAHKSARLVEPDQTKLAQKNNNGGWVGFNLISKGGRCYCDEYNKPDTGELIGDVTPPHMETMCNMKFSKNDDLGSFSMKFSSI